MFSWFNSKPKSNLPEPTALERQRTKQIEQLKIFHHGVAEIQRDLEYRVNAYIHDKTYSLYITLPQQFPVEKPMIKVSPNIQHPWVNEMMVVTGSPSVNNFSVHSDLGKAVKEIVDEFIRNPPTVVPHLNYGVNNRYTPYPTPSAAPATGNPSSYQGYPAYSATSSYVSQVPMPTLPAVSENRSSPNFNVNSVPSNTMNTSNYQAANISAPPAATTQLPGGLYKMPEIPQSFPQMGSLSINESQTLVDNTEKLDEMVSGLPQLAQLYQDRDNMMAQNKQLAEDNLRKKPIFEEKKRVILEKYELLNELRDKFDLSDVRQSELLESFKTQVIQDRLKIAASQAEEEAENIAEEFLDGKIPLDEFKKKYMDIRKLSYLRKAKEEKLQTCLLHYRSS